MLLVNKFRLITLINTQTKHLFSHPREDLISKLVKMLIPSRFTAYHLGYRKYFFTNPSVRSIGAGRDLYGLRANSTKFPIKIRLNLIVTSKEHIIIASVINITKRKRSEQRLQLIINAALTAMLVVNSKGIIQLANVTSDKLFGATPS